MAVIQDLPFELLERILELLGEDDKPRSSLKRASLVARVWRRRAQQLLRSLAGAEDVLDMSRAVMTLLAGCTLRRVDFDELDCFDEPRKVLKKLRKHNVAVHKLSGRIDATYIDRRLLSAKSLKISDPWTGDFDSAFGSERQLEALSLSSLYSPDSMLDSLLGAAPFLTHLNLAHIGGRPALLHHLTTPLQTISTRLRHLTISGDPWSSLSLPSSTRPQELDLLDFVSSCTSLVSLELRKLRVDPALLLCRAVRAPLSLFTTQLFHPSQCRSGDGPAPLGA